MSANKLRLFIAFDIPEEARSLLAAIVEKHKEEFPEARWVKAENLHLTLKFIGDYEEEKLDRLSNEIRKTAASGSSFRAALGGCGGFPSSRKARVLWVGMRNGQEEAALMAGKLDSRLDKVGVKRENRPFKGHLTLARLRRPLDCSSLLEKMEEELKPVSDVFFEVKEMTLYRSILGPGGPTYVSLEKVALGEGSDGKD